MNQYIPLISRILISIIFLMAGFGKIMDPQGTMGYMTAMGMPFTGFFLLGAILMEVGGGLSVLAGYKTKWGAWALVLFLIPTTLIFHHNVGDKMQMIMFLKNLAIMGGLLQLALHGAGACSLDNRCSS